MLKAPDWIRLISVLHLLEYLYLPGKLFAPGSSRQVPTVPVLELFDFGEFWHLNIFMLLVSSLLSMFVSVGLRWRTVTQPSEIVILVSMILLQLADATRSQAWMQVSTGLFFVFLVQDVLGIKHFGSVFPLGIPIASQWTFAGLAKIQPAFLFAEEQEIIDPIAKLVSDNSNFLVAIRLGGALSEGVGGLWLLYVFTFTMNAPKNLFHRYCWIPMLVLACMHSFIFVRLYQMNWARAAWGWNAWFFGLICCFWSVVRNQADKTGAKSGRSARAVTAVVVFFFTIMPVASFFDAVPGIFGHEIYTHNVPEIVLLEVQSPEPLDLPTRDYPNFHKLLLQKQHWHYGTTEEGHNAIQITSYRMRVYEELRVVDVNWIYGYEILMSQLSQRAQNTSSRACIRAIVRPKLTLLNLYQYQYHLTRTTCSNLTKREVWPWAKVEVGAQALLTRTFRLRPCPSSTYPIQLYWISSNGSEVPVGELTETENELELGTYFGHQFLARGQNSSTRVLVSSIQQQRFDIDIHCTM